MTGVDPPPGPAPEGEIQGTDTFRALFERSADAILIIEDGKFIDCNQATVDMLRYSNKEELLKTHPSALSPPTQPDGRDSYDKAEEIIALAFEKGNHRFEWDHVRGDGEIFPAEVLLTVVPVGQKQLLHVVWRDITERKKLESDLRQAQKMEAIGKLAGGIAHDFNNLLVAILGNAEILEMATQDSPRLFGMAKEIVFAAKRAADLTRQLLAFSRKQVLQPRVVDLNASICGLGELLRRVIGENVELETVLGDEPMFLKIDPGQIDQILLNLVANARDAIPGGGLIRVATRQVQFDEAREDLELQSGAYAILEVSDTGQGMSLEIQERAFEPFFTTKGVHEGTGLGLSTVYGIVKQNLGAIEVESEEGQGTTFRLFLPLTLEARSSMREEPQGADIRSPGSSFSGKGRRILVVEDERSVSKLIQVVLERQGYSVVVCSHGQRALELYREEPESYDLILSDVVMPEMTGPELVQILEAEGWRPKLLFASGYMPATLAKLDLWREGADLLQKPFSARELLLRVEQAIARSPRS
jgi:PAS domain S-box-containing protein